MKQKILDTLSSWYQQHPKVLIAFSGGADSCLAAYLGRKFLGKENAIAVISTSPSLKRRDLSIARKFASTYDITLHEIITDEMHDENYTSNPANRCYFCKNSLYQHLNDLVRTAYSDFQIINGNNFDDLGDYRPGMDAAKENKALSPFVDCAITKSEIREMSKQFDLFTWDKPASPCLSSRFPYGENISEGKLKQVEDAEDYLMSLGFADVRVRHFGNLAKVEVPAAELNLLSNYSVLLKDKMHDIGFKNLEIDTEGFVSGKMNRALKKE